VARRAVACATDTFAHLTASLSISLSHWPTLLDCPMMRSLQLLLELSSTPEAPSEARCDEESWVLLNSVDDRFIEPMRDLKLGTQGEQPQYLELSLSLCQSQLSAQLSQLFAQFLEERQRADLDPPDD